MSGYTPVFDSVFRGTLFGRWPTLPVWLTILPMADKNGCIDMTYQAISAASGWPLDLLKQAIAELMAPDPESRTAECEGRRLELIDPDNRQWGWRVVNHTKYREKARKAAFDAERVKSGANKERMQTRDDPRSPAMTRQHPPSDSDANTNTDSNKNTCKSAHGDSESGIFQCMASIKARYPKAAREDWITAERHARALVTDSGVSWEALQAGVERYRKHCDATNRIPLNPSRFFGDVDQPWSQEWPITAGKQRKTKFDQAMEALDRA